MSSTLTAVHLQNSAASGIAQQIVLASVQQAFVGEGEQVASKATASSGSIIARAVCWLALTLTLTLLCRDLTSFELASRMLSEKPNSRFENFVHETVQLGSKATVSAGCIVGKGSVLGDKCSVKRSVIGATCKLGNNVKIVSSIVMDDVIVEEGSHIQNSIICSSCHLKVCLLLFVKCTILHMELICNICPM